MHTLQLASQSLLTLTYSDKVKTILLSVSWKGGQKLTHPWNSQRLHALKDAAWHPILLTHTRMTTAQSFCYSCFYQLPNIQFISKCPRAAWINSKSVQRWQKWNRFDTHSPGLNDVQRITATQEPTPRHHYSLYVFLNQRQLQAHQSNKFFKKLRNSQLFRCKLNTASFKRRGMSGISTDLCAPWAAQVSIISQLASQQVREPTMP